MNAILLGLATTAGQVATLFLLMSAGFILKKLKKVNPDGTKQMTYLLLHVVNPCLIVRSLVIEKSAGTTNALLFSMAGAAVYYTLGALLSMPLFRKKPPDTGDTLRFGSVYTNNGFMGFPLVIALLGQGEAAVAAAGYLAITTIYQWSHGIAIMNRSGSLAFSRKLRQIIVNPGMVAFAVGLVLYLTNFRLPSQIMNAVDLLADANTPLALVIIGIQMADASIIRIIKSKELYILAAIKLIAFPALAGLIMFFFKPTPVVFSAIVILSATPTAGMTGMFAQNYNRDTETAAKAVAFTTILSIITLPAFAYTATYAAGFF